MCDRTALAAEAAARARRARKSATTACAAVDAGKNNSASDRGVLLRYVTKEGRGHDSTRAAAR
jgi:hypothetical protein